MPLQLTIADRIEALRLQPQTEAILGLFELGIEVCSASNGEHVKAVLEALIAGLNFEADAEEIALGFQRLYGYCLEQAAAEHFERVSCILVDLRDTLAQAMAAEARAGEP